MQLDEKGKTGKGTARNKENVEGGEIEVASCATNPRTPILILVMHRRRRANAAAVATAVSAVFTTPAPLSLGRVPNQPPAEPREYAPPR